NNAPDGIYILRWPKLLFTNPAGAALLDAPTPQDAVGIDLAARTAPADVEVAADRIRQKLEGVKLDGPRQYHGRNPNGREYDLEITSIPIEFEGGPAVLSFARDVTERNEMLKKLAEVETHTALNTLAAGVAHEINNPLAYLLLNLEFLARELRELHDLRPAESERMDAMQRRLDDARQGAERVKAIVRDLQALTRKDQNIRGPVELDQVIENALALARHETRQRARVETHFESLVCVTGNSTRLEQLFFNLIANAAHAMGDRDMSQNLIRISLRKDGDDHVLAEITDNGFGMSEEVQRRAFEPFFSTKPLGVGSGLGLPICKRIVEDLGGKIYVTSVPDKGTTVGVRLRVHHERATVPPTTSEDTGTSGRRRGRVLVIDDERAVADSLRFALKEDHEVDTATSSKDARAALDSGTDYDVILCDLVMPVESGMELHAYVRERNPELAQRFVFMTGGAFTPRAEKFLRETKNARIEKPFELETLRSLIDDMVAARNA
ncbi:MAG TPA: ATP-binding protein, partial [Polyangiales bacterium]|nr:ATP-binding protein [Polyangiales bacterium]